MRNDLEQLFASYCERGDVRALAKVFDATAPELLAVALHLAQSRDEAEDLVQATFLSAIESAKSFDASRALLPWLAGVLAMHARKLRERNRRAPVLGDVETIAKDDPAREASERELAVAVDRAVGGLPANYAQIVRRHVVDGARAPELAREFGVSEVNARSRLHRGLKLLRRALPIGLGGGAIAATKGIPRGIAAVRRVVLGQAAHVAGVAVPAAGVSVAIVVALLALPCVATVAWLGTRTNSSDAREPAEVALASGAVSESNSNPSTAVVSSDRREVATSNRNSSQGAPPAALMSSVNVVLRGRLLMPDGTLASGVTLSIHGWTANDDRVEQFGLPQDWNDPEPATSDVDGRFEVAFDPPRAFQFTLEAELPDFVIAEWRWGELEPGSTVDVGDVTLERAGKLIVRVFDAQGNAQCDGWYVMASSKHQPKGKDRESANSHAQCQSGAGEFVLDTVPGGTLEVSAGSHLGASVEGEAVCHAGETTELALAYTGPDLSKRIAVRLRDRVLSRHFPPDMNAIDVTTFGGEPRHPETVDARATGVCYVDDVEPGVYDITLNDPRYEPASVSGSPGELVNLEVRGNAAIRVKLVSPAGEPLDVPYSLAARWPQPNQSSSDLWVHRRSEPTPPDGVHRGFVPGMAMQLVVGLESGAKFELDVPALQANEVREVTQVIDASLAITGRVLATDGATPLGGVLVELTRGSIAGHANETSMPMTLSGVSIPKRSMATTTDSDGRFQFEAFAPGTWTVRARWSDTLVADRSVELAGEPVDVELVQPPHGELIGRLLLPPGVVLDDTVLQAWPDVGTHVSFGLKFERDPSELRDDGTFRLGPFPVGPRRLSLSVFVDDGQGNREASGIPLGEFAVIAGEPAPTEIDVRSVFPGRIRAHVTLDGGPAAGAQLNLRRIDGGSPTGMSGKSLDDEGACLLGSVAPGSQRVVLRDRDKTWRMCVPGTLEIAPGAEVPFELDISTYERDVLVLDAATNQPLANFALGLWTGACDVESEAVRSTDASGKLHLRMPELSVRFASKHNTADQVTPSLVGWGAGGEPIVLHVALAQ